MTEKVFPRSMCSAADMANSSERKEQIPVVLNHSCFSVFLLFICLHREASLLKMIDSI